MAGDVKKYNWILMVAVAAATALPETALAEESHADCDHPMPITTSVVGDIDWCCDADQRYVDHSCVSCVPNWTNCVRNTRNTCSHHPLLNPCPSAAPSSSIPQPLSSTAEEITTSTPVSQSNTSSPSYNNNSYNENSPSTTPNPAPVSTTRMDMSHVPQTTTASNEEEPTQSSQFKGVNLWENFRVVPWIFLTFVAILIPVLVCAALSTFQTRGRRF